VRWRVNAVVDRVKPSGIVDPFAVVEPVASTTISAARRVQFCAGHRVRNHENKCKHLHGHNYQVFFHAQCADGLDELGRVIDFGVLKDKLGSWIEENWDHGFVLWRDDVDAIEALRKLPDQKIYLTPTNPTAENMALYLLNMVAPSLMAGSGVTVTKIVLWETENCFVEVVLNQATKTPEL
jgi:6-pyruvoyltetrahydropterin/6-carboxytetrahydropterin synthase